MEPSDIKILAVSGGSLFLIDAGTGDKLGQVEPLARVFNFGTGRFEGDAWPVSALAGRGYWDDVSDVPESTLAAVRETAAVAA